MWCIRVFGGIVGKKTKTSIALDEELLEWIDSEIKTKRFANRTHAIEYALEQIRKKARQATNKRPHKNNKNAI